MRLGSLPINIVYEQESGVVGFVRLADFHTTIEHLEDGLQIIYSNQDIFIGSETELEYNTPYQSKELPELLYWLKSQGLEMEAL